jgi:hypothetical protein
MYGRILILAVVAFGSGLSPSVWAGIYNTSDAPEETARLSPDFEGVFRNVLLDLKSIPNAGSLANPPIRRRYLLIASLGIRGELDLRTVEAKLDYSAVLIRLGKAEEAVAVLKPMADEHPKNFVVLAQCAMAHFMTRTDLQANALDYMREAMKSWPEQWNQVDADQKKFLEALGWEETAFQRNRRFEEYLLRLMQGRRTEQRMALKQKKPAPESVDAIFGPKDAPVRFVNEKGEFEPGRIPLAESAKMPKDAWDIVEQLLLWMPNDDRLLWLLGEVLNAEAMNQATPDKKDAAIRSAAAVFKQLNNDAFNRQIYAKDEIKTRHEALSAAVAKMPPPRHLKLEDFKIDIDKEDKEPPISVEQWRQALIVGFITGFAVGLFALWQLQEVRRRRAARSMSSM